MHRSDNQNRDSTLYTDRIQKRHQRRPSLCRHRSYSLYYLRGHWLCHFIWRSQKSRRRAPHYDFCNNRPDNSLALLWDYLIYRLHHRIGRLHNKLRGRGQILKRLRINLTPQIHQDYIKHNILSWIYCVKQPFHFSALYIVLHKYKKH